MAKRGSGGVGRGGGGGGLLNIPEQGWKRMPYSEFKDMFRGFPHQGYDAETKSIEVAINLRQEAFTQQLPDGAVKAYALRTGHWNPSYPMSKSDEKFYRHKAGEYLYNGYVQGIRAGKKLSKGSNAEMKRLYKQLGGKVEK